MKMDNKIKINVHKLTLPKITEDEIRQLDNNFNEIVNEFLKAHIKDNDLLLCQHIIEVLQQRIDKALENLSDPYNIECINQCVDVTKILKGKELFPRETYIEKYKRTVRNQQLYNDIAQKIRGNDFNE